MIHLLWLLGAAALVIWMYGRRGLLADDLGTVSAQWLHDYRCETHQNGQLARQSVLQPAADLGAIAVHPGFPGTARIRVDFQVI